MGELFFENGYFLLINQGFELKWWLLKKPTCLDNNDAVIMNSENNTIDELKKFLKEHCDWDLNFVISRFQLIFAIIIFIISVFNTFKNSCVVRYFLWGTLFSLILHEFVTFFVSFHNTEVSEKKLYESVERLKKD